MSALDGGVTHLLRGDFDVVTLYLHCDIGSSAVLQRGFFFYLQVVETAAFVSVHLKVFPHHFLRERVAAELLEPRRGGGIVDGMSASRNQVHPMGKTSGVFGLQRVESLTGETGQRFSEEAEILIACAEAESGVAKIFHRSIDERLTTGHRTCTCQIIGIIGSQALTTIASLGNTKHIYAIGIDVAGS